MFATNRSLGRTTRVLRGPATGRVVFYAKSAAWNRHVCPLLPTARWCGKAAQQSAISFLDRGFAVLPANRWTGAPGALRIRKTQAIPRWHPRIAPGEPTDGSAKVSQFGTDPICYRCPMPCPVFALGGGQCKCGPPGDAEYGAKLDFRSRETDMADRMLPMAIDTFKVAQRRSPPIHGTVILGWYPNCYFVKFDATTRANPSQH